MSDLAEDAVEQVELEKEFRKVYSKISKKIDQHLADADAALSKAVELSEKHGIPFSANISFLGQSYTPESFEEKFPELDRDLVYETTGVYMGEYGAGWEHSAVC